MTQTKHVKGIYSLFNARWYDPFRTVWGSIVSKKAEKDFLTNLKKEIKPQTRILELGCGSGINIGRLQHTLFKQYTALDFSEEMLDRAKKHYTKIPNLILKHQDITRVDHLHYDIIISTWVLSHLEKPADIINKWYSQLAPGGSIYLIFLTKPKWYINLWFYPFA
ncbi:hypothetical protein CMO92_01720 [Candidatus Woesearchaeota archaeon]|nr:hypothetical protein [Candidatus Woesearchaeota archaeon]|tara:strand:- start:54 stop:548 length:495 start_codon:yes stop_codon:yes gene_type:complete